jgi:DNA-binding NarL/FixJ family response regulator
MCAQYAMHLGYKGVSASGSRVAWRIIPWLPGFVRRMQNVCDLVVRGETGKEIGRELGISPRTVEDHRRQIFRKYHVHNAVELTRKVMFRDLGLVERYG